MPADAPEGTMEEAGHARMKHPTQEAAPRPATPPRQAPQRLPQQMPEQVPEKTMEEMPGAGHAEGHGGAAGAAGGAAAKAVDPVCRMEVDAAQARADGLFTERNGATWFFCTPECKREFDADPAVYLPMVR
jgi:YHS domain-containing protein